MQMISVSPFCFQRRSAFSVTLVLSCALRSGKREIPDLLLYLWLCAPCLRHQIYIGLCATRSAPMASVKKKKKKNNNQKTVLVLCTNKYDRKYDEEKPYS